MGSKTDSRAFYEMKITSGMGLIYSPEGVRAHAQAIEQDRDKSYRMVVNIVGKVRQGKTSLRRLLVGEEFNALETSTVGIEHELVETMGMSPDVEHCWSKIDLYKANTEECDLIVGKHVRARLKKNELVDKSKAEIQSLFKTILLTYLMLFLYLTCAESPMLTNVPWFPFMVIVSLSFSGIVLYDTMRDGFGMATGVMCLVIYVDAMFRYRIYNVSAPDGMTSWLVFLFQAAMSFSAIHALMAICMGLSMAMGFCFVLSAMQPPWNQDITDDSLFYEPVFHVFILTVLSGIWTVRHPRLIGVIFTLIALAAPVVPTSATYCAVSGVFCGFTHALLIKAGFDLYVKFANPLLKMIADDRRHRRLICYFLGVFPGSVYASLLGWKLPEQGLILHLICGTMVIVWIEICHCLRTSKTDNAPKSAIKNATKVLDSTISEVRMKFVIRDFAGHQLYHSLHHIYMMGHCIYVICFSFVDAKRNFKASFSDVVYWLQAIYVHGRYPIVRAVIAGTHRDDDSLSKMDVELISDQVLNELPRQFHNMVVWNKTGRPVFPVENSSSNVRDQDHVNLRQTLVRLADGNMKPKYPIKYLYFYRVINECRRAGKLIDTLDNVADLCEKHDCVLTEPGELEDVLDYFYECGEIIYNCMDNNQNQLVVMDPKALLSIMTSLVRPPPRAEREAEFMLAWHTVSDLGIASKRLLHHIIERNPVISTSVQVKSVLELLEYMDLVCKLDLGVDGFDALGEQCYLITPLIKDTLPYPQNYWPDIDTDTIIYIDFGPVVPKFIFTRLVCQCTAENHINIGTDGRYHMNVCTSKALFQYRDTHSFKVELLDIADNLSHSQQLLKLVVRGSSQRGCLEVAQNICRKVCNIVERDFRKCRYKIGVMCPFEGPHDYCQCQERHIFSLYENDGPEGSGSPGRGRYKITLPERKEFWCRGHAFQFLFGQVIVERGIPVHSACGATGQGTAAMWQLNVTDLPPNLFSQICDDLNESHSWTTLAEQLGFSSQKIGQLERRSPRDPCDALLQSWSTSSETPTVYKLAQSLDSIGRSDVASKIEKYLASR